MCSIHRGRSDNRYTYLVSISHSTHTFISLQVTTKCVELLGDIDSGEEVNKMIFLEKLYGIFAVNIFGYVRVITTLVYLRINILR